MKYLLDTNIISELYKPRPHGSVVRWIERQDASTLYLSAITIGEIRRGIEKKRIRAEYPDSMERAANSLLHMETVFAEKIWPFDHRAAHIWATITLCHPDKILDTQIASIALTNQAAIVTRNKDFTDLASRIEEFGISLPLINPFDEAH
ncbi:MAG: PIN domain-containing protein [Alphaproteobacteria bacterium]|nr:PIN domain-containing protein [Alphaproteobacteria bacterium]